MGTWIFLGGVALVVVFVIGVYNRLVALRNRFRNAFAQIDVQLQRRHDLIPNLVESARAYLRHEQATLAAVTEARGQAADARARASAAPDDAGAMNSLGRAESLLSGALASFRAVAENYPELRANETISQLMEELATTENRIGFARQAFNDAVMEYNTAREQFPNNVIAGFFGPFREAQLLRIEDTQVRQPVKVAF